LADCGGVTAGERVVQGYSLAGGKYRPTEPENTVKFVTYGKDRPLATNPSRFHSLPARPDGGSRQGVPLALRGGNRVSQSETFPLGASQSANSLQANLARYKCWEFFSLWFALHWARAMVECQFRVERAGTGSSELPTGARRNWTNGCFSKVRRHDHEEDVAHRGDSRSQP